MQQESQVILNHFGQRVSDYMPTLLAGVVVIFAGAIVGWILKRAVVRMLVLLRLDRLGVGRPAWRAALGKGDVRAALYNGAGTIAGSILFLVFVDNALQIWGLGVLARLLGQVLVYLPTLALAVLILWIGLAFSNIFARRVETLLLAERVPRPQLLAAMAKTAFLCVVAAVAMWELNLARKIVLAAFLIAFGAVGVAFALGVGIGSARAIQGALSSVMTSREDD